MKLAFVVNFVSNLFASLAFRGLLWAGNQGFGPEDPVQQEAVEGYSWVITILVFVTLFVRYLITANIKLQNHNRFLTKELISMFKEQQKIIQSFKEVVK